MSPAKKTGVDPYTTRPFNPATVERKEQIESLIARGKSQSEIYNVIKGSGAGSRKQDVLDYARFLRDQRQAVTQVNSHVYTVSGKDKSGKAVKFEVESELPLTKSAIRSQAKERGIKSVKSSEKPNVIEVLPMGINFQAKQYKYIVSGKARKGKSNPFDYGVTINSDVALSREQIQQKALILIQQNPDHYANNKNTSGADIQRINIVNAFAKNPAALDRMVKQSDANVRYRNRKRKGN